MTHRRTDRHGDLIIATFVFKERRLIKFFIIYSFHLLLLLYEESAGIWNASGMTVAEMGGGGTSRKTVCEGGYDSVQMWVLVLSVLKLRVVWLVGWSVVLFCPHKHVRQLVTWALEIFNRVSSFFLYSSLVKNE